MSISRPSPRNKRRPTRPIDRAADEIVEWSVNAITPSPENELLYRPVSKSDPEVVDLAKSIRALGILEPLVISKDSYLLSGHRRLCAAQLLRLTTVRVRVEPILHTDPRFIEMLREYNRQREKTLAEKTREQVLDADPEEAHRVLIEHRRRRSRIDAPDAIEIIGHKHRAEITQAKRPFLDAIRRIVDERRDYWPLTVRIIHYALLNIPPVIHARKSRRYTNNNSSYKAAIDLIGRARIAGFLPWAAIDDETRPVDTWDVYPSSTPFMRAELDEFLKGYYRDLLQSQPNQIEIVGEKNTLASIIRPVAMEYCIPLTIGRGYSSLPPRNKMAQRFRASGKAKLIVLVLSDHDPEGEDIPHSFARSMRDDFGIDDIVTIKVALTHDQVAELRLPPNNLEAKKTSSRYKRFVERYGKDVFELEAVPPAELQRLLREAIDSVLDVEAFNAEIDEEKRDAGHLDGVRRAVQEQLRGFDFGDGAAN